MVTLIPLHVLRSSGYSAGRSQAVSQQWEHTRNIAQYHRTGLVVFSQRTGLGIELAVMRIGAPQTILSVSNQKLLQCWRVSGVRHVGSLPVQWLAPCDLSLQVESLQNRLMEVEARPGILGFGSSSLKWPGLETC